MQPGATRCDVAHSKHRAKPAAHSHFHLRSEGFSCLVLIFLLILTFFADHLALWRNFSRFRIFWASLVKSKDNGSVLRVSSSCCHKYRKTSIKFKLFELKVVFGYLHRYNQNNLLGTGRVIATAETHKKEICLAQTGLSLVQVGRNTFIGIVVAQNTTLLLEYTKNLSQMQDQKGHYN